MTHPSTAPESARGAEDDVEPTLAELAAAHGVAVSYRDWRGLPVAVRRSAVVSALAALDVDAHDADAAERALTAVERTRWTRPLPPFALLRDGRGTVGLRVREAADVSLTVQLEDGGQRALAVPASVADRHGDRVLRPVQVRGLPDGWHVLRAVVDGTVTEAVLLAAPSRVRRPERLNRAWGWMVQLYSLRSSDSWGVGDYGDLRTVVDATRREGGGVVLLNPLHAETPVVPLTPSPYSPSSRRFRSPLYLRIANVPEYRSAGPDERAAIDSLRPQTDPERINRDPAWAAKLAALERLWPRHRVAELAAWRAGQGSQLEDFALFCALSERHGRPWQQWPQELRSPTSGAVAAAREKMAERVSFWCWVQLLVDEQLRGVGDGLAVGVVHDLAVGVDAGGADAWALQDALALGTTVGAPPDSFNQQGQDWGLPPWRPDRLAQLGYAPFRDVVRGCLRSAGGLRIDHVMGLFRLWWVPPGAGPADGTYVSYDSDAMLGVLALEASRAGALVVGEDLGTVEDRVREDLAAAGVLGSAVLWFQRDEDTGAFLPPQQWPEAALATVTTHDLPTAAGFLAQEQVRVRHELGQLGHSLEREQARAGDERAQLLAMLERTGLLQRCEGDAVLAMHAALAAAPCQLVLAAFGDAVGDLRQPNLPGTVDQYPNWRLPVADGRGRPMSLEDLLSCDGVRRLARLLRQGVASPPGSVR